MNTLLRSKTLESFYFVYGLIMFGFGVYFQDWYVTGAMGAGLLAAGLIQQWRARADHTPVPDEVSPPQEALGVATLTRYWRLKANGGSHSASEWRLLCALYNWRCVACRQERPLTKDHIIPVIQGGGDGITNIQPLCRECNSRKNGYAMEYRRG